MILMRSVPRVLPVGVFCLLMHRVLELPDLVETAKTLGWFTVTVVIGFSVHALLTLPTLYSVLTRRNPVSFYQAILPALITAFATNNRSEFVSQKLVSHGF